VIFWILVSCSLIGGYRDFGGVWCLDLQSWSFCGEEMVLLLRQVIEARRRSKKMEVPGQEGPFLYPIHLTLKNGAARSFKTSISNYRTRRCHNPADHNVRNRNHENIKIRVKKWCLLIFWNSVLLILINTIPYVTTTIYFFTSKRRKLVSIGPICAMRLYQTEHLPNNICIIRRIAYFCHETSCYNLAT
jgi:hypothetical protein